MKKYFYLFITSTLFVACFSTGPKTGTDLSASYIGDRTIYNLPEGILSIPIAGGKNDYENLHYVVTAFVNPLESNVGYSTYDALQIVEKFEPRLSAEIIRKIIPKKPISVLEAQTLHLQILQVANQIFKPYYDRWDLRRKYSIELDVTVFYFSNSVERRRYSNGFTSR